LINEWSEKQMHSSKEEFHFFSEKQRRVIIHNMQEDYDEISSRYMSGKALFDINDFPSQHDVNIKEINLELDPQLFLSFLNYLNSHYHEMYIRLSQALIKTTRLAFNKLILPDVDSKNKKGSQSYIPYQ
jgi:hypothetical protein